MLYHYLTFEPKREGQLQRYISAMTAGHSSRDAALAAFGDFATLERDVDKYLEQGRILTYRIPARVVTPGAIAVRKLGAGEAAMMPVRIRSRRGVDAPRAREVLVDARAIAARFPNDPAVLSALAEAEYDAGNDREAIAAADAALAGDPGQINAYVQKGFALFRIARSAPDRAAAYDAARAPFIALNRREPDHPLPLIYYYRGFVDQGKTPSALAMQGLERAVEIAPFDLGLRMTLATQQVKVGQQAAARANFAPVAYNPHGGALAEYARAAMARLDADPHWDGTGLSPPDPKAADEGDGG